MKLGYKLRQPRSLRGVSGDILKAERGVASCGRRLVTACPGRPGTPPARHYDLAARSSLHGSGRQLPAVVGRRGPEEAEARPRGPKPPRGRRGRPTALWQIINPGCDQMRLGITI